MFAQESLGLGLVRGRLDPFHSCTEERLLDELFKKGSAELFPALNPEALNEKRALAAQNPQTRIRGEATSKPIQELAPPASRKPAAPSPEPCAARASTPTATATATAIASAILAWFLLCFFLFSLLFLAYYHHHHHDGDSLLCPLQLVSGSRDGGFGYIASHLKRPYTRSGLLGAASSMSHD